MTQKTGQPRPLDDVELTELIDVISGRYGTAFRLDGALAGGDGPGAWALTSPDGPAVLKFLPGRGATDELTRRYEAVDVLRARGYPAPRLLCLGTLSEDPGPAGTYVVQERLPGSPVGDDATPGQLDDVVRLLELHADVGVGPSDESWPLPVTRPVLEGADGFCVIETMRAYSSETDDLLTELQEHTRAHMDETSRTGDLVHLDYQFSNILATDGVITGVIDWEAATLGDRAFDLSTLAFYVFTDDEQRRALIRRAAELSGLGAVRVYLAHLMFRQTEWCTRFYGDDRVRFYVDHSRTVLDELDDL